MALINLNTEPEEDKPFYLMGRGTAGDATPGPSGRDPILASMMKQLDDEQAGAASSMQAAEESDRTSRIKQLAPLGIATLVGALIGAKTGNSGVAPAVFQGGLNSIISARDEAKRRREASASNTAQGIQTRRTELYKTLGDIAQERAKARIKAEHPGGGELTTDRVRAIILNKMANGEPLTPSQQAVLDSFSKQDQLTTEQKNYGAAQADPNFMSFLTRSKSENIPPDIRAFQLLTGRMPTMEEFKQFTQRPPSAMELFYFNELPSDLKSRYQKDRGGAASDPAGLR